MKDATIVIDFVLNGEPHQAVLDLKFDLNQRFKTVKEVLLDNFKHGIAARIVQEFEGVKGSDIHLHVINISLKSNHNIDIDEYECSDLGEAIDLAYLYTTFSVCDDVV